MRKIKVKAVIFDMDGVITNTMPFHWQAWRKVLKEEALNVTKCEIYLREGQPGIVTIRELLKERGLSFSKDKAQDILFRKEKLFKKILKKRFIVGSRGFLHSLKAGGFSLALVTGTSRHEVERILPGELRDLFVVIVTGDEVKKGKPHPEPYLIAISKLGVKAKEAVVIENAPFGIYSAKRAKLVCFALETSLGKRYLKDADFVFSSFKELQKKVVFELMQSRV